MGTTNSTLSLPHGEEILRSGAYADLELRCEGRTWLVHKNVLCPQSEWFKAAGDGGYRETEERVITLNDDDPDSVEAMLSYLYTKDYSDESSLLQKTTLRSRPATFNVHVFAIGDKFLIPGLTDLATKKFEARIKQVGGSDLLEATAEAYATVPLDRSCRLRDVVAAALVDNVDKLFSDRAGRDAFCKIAEKHPAFAADTGKVLHHRARALRMMERKVVSCRVCARQYEEMIYVNRGDRIACVCRFCKTTMNFDLHQPAASFRRTFKACVCGFGFACILWACWKMLYWRV